MTPLTPAARTPKPEELPVHSARGRGRVGRGLCPQETFRFRGEEDSEKAASGTPGPDTWTTYCVRGGLAGVY